MKKYHLMFGLAFCLGLLAVNAWLFFQPAYAASCIANCSSNRVVSCQGFRVVCQDGSGCTAEDPSGAVTDEQSCDPE